MTTAIKNNRVISSEQEFEELFSQFSSFTNRDFRKKVCEVIGRGGSVVVKRNTGDNHWDGSLTILFPTPPSASEVVNTIKAAGRPDDFGMDDDKTLWLWWD